MYHKDYAPKGQMFDVAETPQSLLISQGWVDNPAKIGVNVWTHAGSDEAVYKLASRYDSGHLAPVDDDMTPPPAYAEELETLRQKNIDLQKRLEELRQPESVAKQGKMAREKEADLRSDAAKITPTKGRKANDESKAGKAMIEQANETQLEQERDEAAAAAEMADLAAQAGRPVVSTDL